MTHDNLYIILVAILLWGQIHKTLYEISFPKQQSAVLSAWEHFAVRKSVERRNVRKLHLPEFCDVAL